jgi:hypothetical protein
MTVADKYDLQLTDALGESHGLIADWSKGGAGLKVDSTNDLKSSKVSTKGDYGVRDANDWYRIVQTDWSEGSGQTTWDREVDSESAYSESTSIDVGTKGKLKLGPASTYTADLDTSAASCAGLVDGSGNPIVWRADLAAPYILYSKDGVTWSVPAATTSDLLAPPSSICTDGAFVYATAQGATPGVFKVNISDVNVFSAETGITHLAFASGQLYGTKGSSSVAASVGAFSGAGAFTALTPEVTSAINAAGSTFGLVADGNYVYWGITNGMVTKVYKVMFVGAGKDIVQEVTALPSGFVGQSMYSYLGTVYVGGHFDGETATEGIGAIYSIINDSPALLTDVGDNRTEAWGVISIASYERNLYFLTANRHVYRWDLRVGGYSHVMDVAAGESLSIPPSWSGTWDMVAEPTPATVTNTSTTITYPSGSLQAVQNAAGDTFLISRDQSFVDATGSTVEVDLPANAISNSPATGISSFFEFGIEGSVKGASIRMWRNYSDPGGYFGEIYTGATVLTSFSLTALAATTIRLTLKDTTLAFSVDGTVAYTGVASGAKSGNPKVWLQVTKGAGTAVCTTLVKELRWSTAGIFDPSQMSTLAGSSLVCARDKVWALCQSPTFGGCEITSTTQYVLTGSLTSSKSSGNMPTIGKFFQSIDVQFEQYPTNTTATMVYQIDAGIIIPATGTMGTGGLMNFPIGVRGRNIAYTITLTTAVPLQTPIVTEIAVLFNPMPKTPKTYTYFIRCWDRVETRVTGQEWDEDAVTVADWLEDLVNTVVTVERPGRVAFKATMEGLEYLEAPPSMKSAGREGLYSVTLRGLT